MDIHWTMRADIWTLAVGILLGLWASRSSKAKAIMGVLAEFIVICGIIWAALDVIVTVDRMQRRLDAIDKQQQEAR